MERAMTAQKYDAVVIGAGANGLTAAAALGEAGLRVLLLEPDKTTGGQGKVVEFAPGFRAAPLGSDPGWLPPAVARALRLSAIERTTSDSPLSVAVEPGKFLTLSRDTSRAAEAIRAHSPGDASKWPAFTARLRKLAGFLEVLYQTPAPDIDARSLGDLLPLLGVGRKFRALGRVDMIEFLRTLPMSVWELLDDWFESAPLKAAVAAGGIQDFQQGPRSGGTGFVVLYALGALPRIPGLASSEALAGVVTLTPRVESLERAADAAKYGTVSEKPHVEVTVPTLLWPDLAPQGKHVLVARAQYAPYRLADAAAWDVPRRDALAASVTAAIEAVAPGFSSTVLHQAAWSPHDLERQFGLREGAASHGELGLDQILFMRPVAGWGQHATPITGLYLGGAGAHPGPGILGGPGWLAARRLLGDRRRRNGAS